MQIFVRTLAGKSIALECNPNDTIHSVQDQIRQREGIPIDEQRIVFGGKNLDSSSSSSSSSLSDHNVQANSTLHLTLRVAGGGIFQLLSWLRARHNGAFRTANTTSVPTSVHQDSPAAAGSPGAGGGHSSVRRKHGSMFEVATDSDYAVVAVDINAMLHEVASSVTSDQQTLIYEQVEREILRRLGLQIEELVRIAGGDSLRPRNAANPKTGAAAAADGGAYASSAADNNKNNSTSGSSSSNSDGVLTRDILIRANPHSSNLNQSATSASSTTDSTLFTLISSPEGDEERALLADSYSRHALLPVDVLLVVDGVAPLGKCAQQRERRSVRKPYNTATSHDSGYFQRQQRMLLERQEQQNQSGGRIAEHLGRSSAIWDANAITVGTPFMNQVCAIVHYTAASLVRQYRNLRAFVSDASVPGEGEQKIFTALKCGMLCTKQLLATSPLFGTSALSSSYGSSSPPASKQQPVGGKPAASFASSSSSSSSSSLKDDTRRICICSNDTDSIIMALLLVDDAECDRAIDVWRTPSSSQQMMTSQRKEHEANLREQAAEDAAERSTKTNNNPLRATLEQQVQKSWVFDMSIFVEELKRDLHWTNNSSSDGGKKRNFGGAMRSLAFMVSIFGGDFLPRVADLSIADGDLDDLIDVLGTELFVRDRWVVDPVTGAIDLQAAMYCLKCLAERKYGVNNNSNNTLLGAATNSSSSSSSGPKRRTRAGGAISLVMGDAELENAYNPFGTSNAAVGVEGGTTNSGSNRVLVGRDRELVSVFWEGLIWVGRYFDGVTVSWSWFFRHPGGEMSSSTASSSSSSGASAISFGNAPRLRDLICDETVLTGRASAMAARATIVYQALLRRDYATMQATQKLKSTDNAQQQQQQQSTVSSTGGGGETLTKTQMLVKDLVMTPEEINPVAIGASVLPDVSWPNLLPRALSDILRKANDSWNEQRLEVQQRRHRGEVANSASSEPSSPRLSASGVNDDDRKNNNKSKNNNAPAQQQQQLPKDAASFTPDELAFEFIRSLKVPVTSFNPLATVGICCQLIAAIQHKFTREEMKLLKLRYTYRLGWAAVKAPTSFSSSASAVGDGKSNNSNTAAATALEWKDNIVSEAAAAAARKKWNEDVANVSYSDLVALGAKQTAQPKKNDDEDFCIFPPKSSDEQLDLLFLPLASTSSFDDDIRAIFPHYDEVAGLVQAAADSQRNRQESSDEQTRTMRAQLKDTMDVSNNNSSSHPVGWYTVPGAIRFTGTASAANLTAFPTFSNTPVPAAGGGEAVMLQYAVQIPV